MTFQEYEEAAQRTAIYPKIGESFVYPAMGLAGEAGEVLEKVKKLFRDKPERNEEWRIGMAKEIGDVLWYVTILANEFGISLEEVARLNIEKLASREARGTLHGDGDDR